MTADFAFLQYLTNVKFRYSVDRLVYIKKPMDTDTIIQNSKKFWLDPVVVLRL